MSEKVTMQSADGRETREVDADPKVLVPLMVKGWRQAPEQKAEPTDPGAIETEVK